MYQKFCIPARAGDWKLLALVVVLTALPTGGRASTIVKTADGPVLVRALDQGLYDPEADNIPGRDPFNWPPEIIAAKKALLLDRAAAKFAEVQLGGIIWDEKLPLAIIDGKLVQEKDRVNDVLVRKIERDRVYLEWEDQKYTLQFNKLFELGKTTASSSSAAGSEK